MHVGGYTINQGLRSIVCQPKINYVHGLNKYMLKVVCSCCCNAALPKVYGVGICCGSWLFYARGLQQKYFWVFSRCIQCLWVCMVTQLWSPSNVCVWAVDTYCVWAVYTDCAYTKHTFHLHVAWHSFSVFTAFWCGCSVMKLTFYLHQTPSWL